MSNKKLDKYLENYPVYFSSRLDDNERVFNTINKLLSFNKKNLILENKSLLDVGSGDKAFFDCCIKKKINVSEIDGSHGINFEEDKISSIYSKIAF